jgi:hypothetical protein
MPMSTITVAGINPALVVLGPTQQLNYNLEVGTLQLNNNFIPVGPVSSFTHSEIRNNLLSGFRWTHQTTSTDTYGTFTLQSFVNGQNYTLGTNMIRFSSAGIDTFVPINFNNESITGGIWNGAAIDVPYGGTGLTSTTAYSVICGGTTSTGALQSVSGTGTLGQVLTSNGPGTLPTWQGVFGNVVSSLTGTANQVLVNGTSGSPTTGAVTLTLPQSIDTAATLQFAKLGLGAAAGAALFSVGASNQFQINTTGIVTNGTWQGTLVDVPYGGTGIASTTAYSVICGGTTSTGALQSVATLGTLGQVLTSNGNGALPTWQSIPSNVSSLTGTANQVLVNGTSGSPTTGAVTLTLPQSVATSSDVQFNKLGLGGVASNSALEVVNLNAQIGFAAGTAAPTNGLIVSGNVSIGSSTATELFNVGSSNQFQVSSTGLVVAPFLFMTNTAIPTPPVNVNSGIYSVNTGKPTFTSGTAIYRGTIVTSQTGVAGATSGTANMNGTVGALVNTTAITTNSIVLVTRSTGAGGAPAAANTGWITVGSIVNNTSFRIFSTDTGDTSANGHTVHWLIINP